MTHDLSRRLVEAACTREGVREKLPGEWSSANDALTNCLYEKSSYTGPDLTRPNQLHNLLKLADAVSESAPVEISRSGINCVYTFHVRIVTADKTGKLTLDEGHGRTRTDAVIAALCAALWVDQ